MPGQGTLEVARRTFWTPIPLKRWPRSPRLEPGHPDLRRPQESLRLYKRLPSDAQGSCQVGTTGRKQLRKTRAALGVTQAAKRWLV